MNPGRNDACPCGSGKKYKKCCGVAGAPGPDNPAAQVNEELRRLIGDRKFTSMEELQAFVNGEMQRRNDAPQPGFQGLSPDQMHRILHYPFESPHVARFHTLSDELAARVPIVALFQVIAAATGEKGLKATALGNLPRSLCRAAFTAHPSGHRHLLRRGVAGIQKEDDFYDLHVARIVAELAGLLKQSKGKFILTALGRKVAASPGALFDVLLRAFTGKYNWAYGDSYSALPFLRASFLFTLFLLQRYGLEAHRGEFYAEQFIAAFPMVLREATPHYHTPEEEVVNAYIIRAFTRFAVPFGLAEERQGEDWRTSNNEFWATPLLAQLVVFPSVPQFPASPPPTRPVVSRGIAAPLPPIDFETLRPLGLHPRGIWDPQEYADQFLDEGIEVPDWAAELLAAGERHEFEMEQVSTVSELFDDAITRAVDLRERGRHEEARRVLETELSRDVRCLDAHAHLGNGAFDKQVAAALAHYETGVRIGELTVPPGFPGVLPWSWLDNRPFLRCLHGYGLCLWRLGRLDEARAVFKRMLWLNPNDNQGARILLDDIARGKKWEEDYEE